MAPSPGARLLLASLAWARGRGPDLAPLARATRSFRRLLPDAGRFGIAEALAYAIAASGADDAVPPDARTRLRAVHEAGTASNLALLAEAARLQAILAAAGIPSVALKGTALVAVHYPMPGARHVGDLDLLVPRDRVEEAARALALADAGRMRPELLAHDGGAAEQPWHLPVIETASGLCCELHFRAAGDEGGHLTPRVLERARSIAVPGGGTLAVPSPVDCAAVACLHGLAGHHGAPAYLPRLVSDLEALDATAGLDWPAIAAAAGPAGEDAVAGARAVLEAARRGEVARVFPGRLRFLAQDLLRPFARRAVSDPGGGLRTFFPTPRFMAARYGVPERSPRLLLYYVARPFLAVRDRLRR